MKKSLLACVLAWSLSACSSGGGWALGKPSGVIGMTLLGTSDVALNSSQTLDITGQFSVRLFELNYNAQFNASIISYTAPAPASCYTVSMDSTGAIATFSPRSGAASICSQPGSDTETALFVDQQEHQVSLAFTNIPAASTQTFTVTLSNATTLSPSPSLPTIVSNAFQATVVETGYSGPFTASIVSHTAASTTPCYGVAMDATGKIATFAPTSVSAACAPPNTDVEGVQFEDSRGYASAILYFQNSGTSVNGPIETLAGVGVLNTTLAAPQNVDSLLSSGFTIVMSSPSNLAGVTYVAQVVSESGTAASPKIMTPCLNVPSNKATSFAITIMTPGTAPCSAGSGETEGVSFTDSNGNSDEQFFTF